ncbi:hypothetical protein D3C71_1476460 [compost metagenome]
MTFARVGVGLGANIGVKTHGIALHRGADAARERCCAECGMQAAWAQGVEPGFALQGASGGCVVALHGGAAAACLKRGVGHRPAGTVVAGVGLQRRDRQAPLIPRAGQGVVQISVDGPARG